MTSRNARNNPSHHFDKDSTQLNIARCLSKRVSQNAIRLCQASAFTILLSQAAIAQSQSITADADGTGTVVTINANTYDISGGTQAGANLFHSFQDLSLQPSEIANFLSNSDVANIIGRVTEGNTSVIEGMIRVSGGNSNLFLVNPAGWIFTSGASLNVPGSFGVTTANRIEFEGGFFNAIGENNYAALMGSPTGLIFDSQTPATILNEADLTVPNGSLWMVGGNVISTGSLETLNGTITLAAVPGERQVQLTRAGMNLGLILDAAPVQAAEDTGITGLKVVNIPRYLAGGSDIGHATTVIQGADGTLQLQGVNPTAQNGQTVIREGAIAAKSVVLMGSEVQVADPSLVQGETTVVVLPEQVEDAIGYTFIDEQVDNPHQLLYGGTAGTISTLIGQEDHGIAFVSDRISDIAASGHQLDSLSIVTEGNGGNIWLGKDFISHRNLAQYQTHLQQWQTGLGPMADLLIYSCFTALGIHGEALLAGLAVTTGTDVAASTNLTGSAHLGGDWNLEYQTGTIEAATPFTSETQASYQGVLNTLTVETTADDTTTGSTNSDGLLNLREALEASNSDSTVEGQVGSGADIIRFDPTTFAGVQTITLANGQLEISDDATIAGTGQNNLLIDGNSNSRVLNVSADNLTIKDITIQNGRVNGRGSGINFTGTGTLTLENSQVSGNTSDGGFTYGAGIASLSGDITLTDSIVSNNTATRKGGGIYTNSGNVTLTNSTVSGNNATSRGGGIYANLGEVTLTDSTVSGNITTSRGGGIHGATVQLTDSTVSGNMSRLGGGGIYARNLAQIENSTVSGNTALSGGGIISYTGTVNLTDSTVSGNSSRLAAGILTVTANLTNSTISGNTSSGHGGGLGTSGATIRNSTITNNTARFTGGGIWRWGGSGTIDIANTIVAENVADGAGNDLFGTFATIQDSLISDITGPTINTSINNITGVNPQLFPLGDYGGTTQTHALRPDSPALDAGNNAVVTTATGQRGATRIFNGTVDLGAYESHGFSLLAVTSPSPVDLDATAFSPLDTSVQVVEDAFSKPLPLDGLSVDYSLNQSGVLGAFDQGTTVVTNAQGIAVNSLSLTGFEQGFSGSFQVLTTAVNPVSFVQPVEQGLISVDTFKRSIDPVASTDPVERVESSPDVNEFVVRERRDLESPPVEDPASNCATILEVKLDDDNDGHRLQESENCPSDIFPSPSLSPPS